MINVALPADDELITDAGKKKKKRRIKLQMNPGRTVVTSGREREASRLQLMTIIGTRG